MKGLDAFPKSKIQLERGGARMERQVSAPTFTAHTEEAGEGGMKAEEPARCASNSEKMH